MTDHLPIVNWSAVSNECESLPLANDTKVLIPKALNAKTLDYDILNGMLEAIARCGFGSDLSQPMNCERKSLTNGWDVDPWWHEMLLESC